MNDDRNMNILRKIKLSAQYGKGIYLASAIYSLAAAVLCFFKPLSGPTCIIMKLLDIPIIWYLFKSLQDRHAIYFYLNLGVSRTEYYATPFVVEFICFLLLLTLSISMGYVIR